MVVKVTTKSVYVNKAKLKWPKFAKKQRMVSKCVSTAKIEIFRTDLTLRGRQRG